MRSFIFLLVFMACYGATHAQQDPLSIAQNLFESEQYDEAIAALKSPSTAVGVFLLADCYHKKEAFKEALSLYNEAQGLGYAEEDLFLHRGICLVSLEDYEKAEEDLIAFFHLNPEEPKVHYYLGVIDYMVFNNRESLFHLNQAIDLDPNYMEAIYLKAANLAEMGKHEQSMEAFAKCAELKPDFSSTKLNMAVNYIELKDYFNAETILTQLINNEADCLAEALYYRGWIYYTQRHMSKACDDWLGCTKLGHPDGTRSYTEVCENSGKTKRKKHTIVAF